MKYKKILVTGGAGFIGSFLTDKLVELGYAVRILDNLDEQVHHGNKPAYLNPDVEFIHADVRDQKAMVRALAGVDAVFHLASKVGVAQSNYEIREYTDVNVNGTANLIDIIVDGKIPIRKIIMTASMTSYGEGLYNCGKCGKFKPPLREKTQMIKNDWELHCPNCGLTVNPIATQEDTKLANNSMYSLTKNVQEQMLMLMGKMYGIPAVSLRCFNVYGPRQSLSNPYTGVAAIFISRLKNNQPPVVYEDGRQTRDFVSVHDVVDALIRAMISDKADYESVNIGSGKPTSILELAEILAGLLRKKIKPFVRNEYRVNDIRHCFADIAKARTLLGWSPHVVLKEGLAELIRWSEGQHARDSYEQAEKELRERKLL